MEMIILCMFVLWCVCRVLLIRLLVLYLWWVSIVSLSVMYSVL